MNLTLPLPPTYRVITLLTSQLLRKFKRAEEVGACVPLHHLGLQGTVCAPLKAGGRQPLQPARLPTAQPHLASVGGGHSGVRAEYLKMTPVNGLI